MPDLLILLPDFALIALGYLICHHTALNRTVWDSAERLVYYLLFPVLLFQAIVRSPIHPGALLQFGGVGLAVMGCGIALAFALGRVPGVDPLLHASGAQTAFRFNSYVALALAERLAGAQGVAWQAFLAALCVPVANVAAVWPLARQGGHGYLKELVRNPLIVSTLAGLVANLAGLHLPDLVALTMSRIGGAALPLGLMAVGAGLRFGALRQGPGLAVGLMAIRHLALSYAYGNIDEANPANAAEVTLRSGTDEVAAALRRELGARFAQAGLVVVDAQLTHLAYAPEIAGTMLRRQQAEAIIAARNKIVQGAVGMVELALNGLAERGLLQLDDERKAAMVSNLLVVLCSDHDATPVVNTGTLYN